MKFQIIEKIKGDIEVSKNLKNYDTKIYIEDNPVRMVIEINDSCNWAYQHTSFKVRLISMADSEIEEEEYYGNFSDAIDRFNDIKEQYGKLEL